jgi:hypothetical protein
MASVATDKGETDMRKHIRGIVLVLLILLLPCLVWAEDEPENDIEITLNWGFNGKAGNSDACLPVTATLTNHGEAFEGQLEMEVPVAGNQESDLGESLTMIGNDMDYTRSKVCVWKKNIALAAGETRQETFYLTFPWANGTVQAYLKDGSRTVQTASLSKNFSANQDIALIGVIGAQPEDVQQLDGIQISEETTEGMGDIFVSVYQMDPSEIPDSWKDLGQLDALLIGPEAAISGEQWVTLHRWQQEGGILLTVEDGQDFFEVFENFLNGESRPTFFDRLSEKWGYVVYTGYDTSQIPVRKRPSLIKYFILILFYACLAGPGLYLILKKQGKRKYFWSGVTLLSVLFLGIVALLGTGTRLTAPVLTMRRMYTQQDHIWGETLQLGVQAPYNNTYQLYLDKSYHLTMPSESGYSAENVNTNITDKVEIYEKEDCYKLTFSRLPVFAGNAFFLNRDHAVSPEEEIQIHASGDNEHIEGRWKNPTGYRIENAILVLTNRIVFLGDLEPGEEGTFSEKIHSYGNGGLEKILRKYLDLKDTEYPDYAVNAVTEQIWDAQRKEIEGACLLGTISNSDTSFEMNSGYEVDGITQFYMPVDISWQKEEGTIFCPNGEVLASVESGSATAGTNLMYGQDAVLNYDLSGLGEITGIKFFKPEYDDPKYFESFRGQVAFYCWSSGEYETISKWEKLFDGTELEKYLSEDGTLRVRYQVADDMDVTDKNCTLPCLQITGKVVTPDA